MKHVVIDLETTIRCPVGNNKGNPMWRGNYIVAAGYKTLDGPYGSSYNKYGVSDGVLVSMTKDNLVIGHNVKFDLLYIYRGSELPLPQLWDTQLAAYLLSGQRHLYASLDDLTKEYVGEHAIKDDKVKEMWRQGVDTPDIPESMLLPYLESDVFNTEAIFKRQWQEAEQFNMLPLLLTQMDALRATTEMARNGMYVDWDYVTESKNLYSQMVENCKECIRKFTDVDVASPKQLSLYFFGGEEKYKEKELVGKYKNGKDKYKTVEKVRYVRGKYITKEEVGKSGYYSTDDSVLQTLADVYKDEVADLLLTYRKASKISETYYGGLNDLRFPNDYIYPNLNHCATKTGRLSATNPNLQNQTDEGGVKKAYCSRYGDEGSILELDYSQLEMVALAFIANDQQLIDDINNGRDMHKELYKEMYGRYPTDKERKPFKRFSFLLVYGGGASTLMAQSGCNKETAKRFISTFYNRYSGVKKYHERIVKEAEKYAQVSYVEDKPDPIYTYYLESPTGRHYIFNKYPSKYKKGLSFSPTELKNWPIQGFATGDVVPMMVGILLKTLEEEGLTPDVKLVMTVHDSVVLDVPNTLLDKCATIAKQVLESAPEYLKTIFNIDFPCILKVGVEAGKNWQQKEEI